jgi:endo-1,4-beta-D-glucanase Y
MTLAAAIAALLAAAVVTSCGTTVQPVPQLVVRESTVNRDARDAAYRFLDTYTDMDGRVVRRDEGGDTVGEGQAYGMLAAAAVGDAPRFDRIWNWTKAHLVRRDGLLSFHWANGRVDDRQAAADADLDAAHALLVASCTLGRPGLRDAGVRIGRGVLAHETARANGKLVLGAGPWAVNRPRIVVNPSYLDPRALDWLAQASGDKDFTDLATNGRDVIGRLARDLPPDWGTIASGSGVAMAAASPGGGAGPARFGFDAARTLVRLAADGDAAGRRIAARAWPAFRALSPDRLVVEHALNGRPAGATRHPIALVAAAGAASAAGDKAASGRLLAAAAALQRAQPTYYGAAWVALGRLMLTTNRLQATSCTTQ